MFDDCELPTLSASLAANNSEMRGKREVWRLDSEGLLLKLDLESNTIFFARGCERRKNKLELSFDSYQLNEIIEKGERIYSFDLYTKESAILFFFLIQKGSQFYLKSFAATRFLFGLYSPGKVWDQHAYADQLQTPSSFSAFGNLGWYEHSIRLLKVQELSIPKANDLAIIFDPLVKSPVLHVVSSHSKSIHRYLMDNPTQLAYHYTFPFDYAESWQKEIAKWPIEDTITINSNDQYFLQPGTLLPYKARLIPLDDSVKTSLKIDLVELALLRNKWRLDFKRLFLNEWKGNTFTSNLIFWGLFNELILKIDRVLEPDAGKYSPYHQFEFLGTKFKSESIEWALQNGIISETEADKMKLDFILKQKRGRRWATFVSIVLAFTLHYNIQRLLKSGQSEVEVLHHAKEALMNFARGTDKLFKKIGLTDGDHFLKLVKSIDSLQNTLKRRIIKGYYKNHYDPEQLLKRMEKDLNWIRNNSSTAISRHLKPTHSKLNYQDRIQNIFSNIALLKKNSGSGSKRVSKILKDEEKLKILLEYSNLRKQVDRHSARYLIEEARLKSIVLTGTPTPPKKLLSSFARNEELFYRPHMNPEEFYEKGVLKTIAEFGDLKHQKNWLERAIHFATNDVFESLSQAERRSKKAYDAARVFEIKSLLEDVSSLSRKYNIPLDKKESIDHYLSAIKSHEDQLRQVREALKNAYQTKNSDLYLKALEDSGAIKRKLDNQIGGRFFEEIDQLWSDFKTAIPREVKSSEDIKSTLRLHNRWDDLRRIRSRNLHSKSMVEKLAGNTKLRKNLYAKDNSKPFLDAWADFASYMANMTFIRKRIVDKTSTPIREHFYKYVFYNTMPGPGGVYEAIPRGEHVGKALIGWAGDTVIGNIGICKGRNQSLDPKEHCIGKSEAHILKLPKWFPVLGQNGIHYEVFTYMINDTLNWWLAVPIWYAKIDPTAQKQILGEVRGRSLGSNVGILHRELNENLKRFHPVNLVWNQVIYDFPARFLGKSMAEKEFKKMHPDFESNDGVAQDFAKYRKALNSRSTSLLSMVERNLFSVLISGPAKDPQYEIKAKASVLFDAIFHNKVASFILESLIVPYTTGYATTRHYGDYFGFSHPEMIQVLKDLGKEQLLNRIDENGQTDFSRWPRNDLEWLLNFIIQLELEKSGLLRVDQYIRVEERQKDIENVYNELFAPIDRNFVHLFGLPNAELKETFDQSGQVRLYNLSSAPKSYGSKFDKTSGQDLGVTSQNPRYLREIRNLQKTLNELKSRVVEMKLYESFEKDSIPVISNSTPTKFDANLLFDEISRLKLQLQHSIDLLESNQKTIDRTVIITNQLLVLDTLFSLSILFLESPLAPNWFSSCSKHSICDRIGLKGLKSALQKEIRKNREIDGFAVKISRNRKSFSKFFSVFNPATLAIASIPLFIFLTDQLEAHSDIQLEIANFLRENAVSLNNLQIYLSVVLSRADDDYQNLEEKISRTQNNLATLEEKIDLKMQALRSHGNQRFRRVPSILSKNSMFVSLMMGGTWLSYLIIHRFSKKAVAYNPYIHNYIGVLFNSSLITWGVSSQLVHMERLWIGRAILEYQGLAKFYWVEKARLFWLSSLASENRASGELNNDDSNTVKISEELKRDPKIREMIEFESEMYELIQESSLKN